jgi:hypothetical protein
MSTTLLFALFASALGADLNLYGRSRINFDSDEDGDFATVVLQGGSHQLNCSVPLQATDFVIRQGDNNPVSMQLTISALQVTTNTICWR